MLWSGEEQGLLGSAGYVAKHRDEMQRISAVFVHDAGTNYLSGVNAPASMIEQLKLVFEPLFGLDPSKQFALNENRGMSPGGGTDNGPFIAAGVPAFAWRQTGRTSYFHSWHTQYDTIDFVVPEYQQHSALVAAITAYNVANLPALLSRENMLAPAPRRMGVNLDETIVTSVSEGSKAEQAGWLEGDVILSIDGEPVDSRRAVVRQLQAGGPRKLIVLRRGTEEIESILDYSPLE